MKAVIFTEQGGPEVLRYEEVPDPVAQAGEVLVELHAASINAADYKVRNGSGGYHVRFPHILGRDFSGVVRAVGPGVSDFAVGAAVFGVLDPGIEGTYAEKLAVKAATIAAKPDWLSHTDAAALALTGITAIWALEDTAALRAGETILIQGGAGGVAGFAIQLARHLGARVITTASLANHDYVRTLGADQVIDYNAEDFTKAVEPCDVVFDTVGGNVQLASFSVLKPGGRLVFISSGPPGAQPPRQDVNVLRPAVARDRAHLQRILALLECGAVKPPPVRSFHLDQARKRIGSVKAVI
jgi:NADPH:quinone reductase-like Zn-dependent oxidoreductase